MVAKLANARIFLEDPKALKVAKDKAARVGVLRASDRAEEAKIKAQASPAKQW